MRLGPTLVLLVSLAACNGSHGASTPVPASSTAAPASTTATTTAPSPASPGATASPNVAASSYGTTGLTAGSTSPSATTPTAMIPTATSAVASPTTRGASANTLDATGHWVGAWYETNSASGGSMGTGQPAALALDLTQDSSGNVTGTVTMDNVNTVQLVCSITQGTCDSSGNLSIVCVDQFGMNTFTYWGQIVPGPPDAIGNQYTVDRGPFARNAGFFLINR